MRRLMAVYQWDLGQAVTNRYLQVFGVVCVMGGSALLAASPGPETLPLVLIQAILFFGSLFAFLIGWGSGQQARAQGAFLFAQPIGPGELLGGKWLGTGTWCLLLLALFMAPAASRAGMPGTIAALGGLSLGLLWVCLLGGLLLGLIALPVTGLMAVLTAWGVVVAGWELGLLVLSEAAWMQDSPGLFVTLLLMNPAGAFRIGAMIGLEAVPLDADELETGRWVFENIMLVTAAIFAAWVVVLLGAGRWLVGRQEF